MPSNKKQSWNEHASFNSVVPEDSIPVALFQSVVVCLQGMLLCRWHFSTIVAHIFLHKPLMPVERTQVLETLRHSNQM